MAYENGIQKDNHDRVLAYTIILMMLMKVEKQNFYIKVVEYNLKK